MVTRGDDDMRITRKLGKAIAARLDPVHPRQVRTAKLLAPPEGRRGILHDAPSPFLTSASAPWEYKDFADLPEADQRMISRVDEHIAHRFTPMGPAARPCSSS